MKMRKVETTQTPVEAHIEAKITLYAREVDSYTRELDGHLSRGLAEAAGSNAAERLAQYSEVVRVLESAGPDLNSWAAQVAAEARDDLRDGDLPRWRLLANADLLDVVSECLALRGE